MLAAGLVQTHRQEMGWCFRTLRVGKRQGPLELRRSCCLRCRVHESTRREDWSEGAVEIEIATVVERGDSEADGKPRALQPRPHLFELHPHHYPFCPPCPCSVPDPNLISVLGLTTCQPSVCHRFPLWHQPRTAPASASARLPDRFPAGHGSATPG
jgi:hypothetical protein